MNSTENKTHTPMFEEVKPKPKKKKRKSRIFDPAVIEKERRRNDNRKKQRKR